MGHDDPGVIRVAVVDDDEILLHGIHSWLCQGNSDGANPVDGLEVQVVATAKSVVDLLTQVRSAARQPPPGTTNGHHRNNGVNRPVDAVGRASVPTVPTMRARAYAEEPVRRYTGDPPRGYAEEPVRRLAPVALMDLRLRDGRRVAENVQALIDAGYAVVTCSTIDDAGLVHEAGRAGALSYVRKSREAGDMRQALAAAARGERFVSQSHAALIQRARSYGVPELSGQEREALRLYASGLTMSSVARRLNVKQGTAKSYLDRVRDKYEQAGRAARTKLELRDRAVEDGVLSTPRPE